jgi:hypothetical protein
MVATIGNYGVNENEVESDSIISGCVNFSFNYSLASGFKTKNLICI